MLVILSLVVQVLLDHAALPPRLGWSVRIAAPLAAIVVSSGFFVLAHAPELRIALYAGAILIVWATLGTGIGLLRAPRRVSRA